MSPVEQLERVITEERQALLHRDWGALDRCTVQKDALVVMIRDLQQSGTSSATDQLKEVVRLRPALEHNARLAGELSRQMSSMVRSQYRAPVYTRHATVRLKSLAMVHRSV